MLNVRSTCLLLGMSLAGLVAALPVAAQSTAPDQPTQASTAAPQDQSGGGAPAATPAAPTWSIGPIDFSGTIDGYYSWNAQHPVTKTNELYNFNIPTNTFSLNMAKIALSHTADPVGFEFDLMYGDTPTQISTVSGSDNFFDRNVEQAYVSFKPPKAKGFEVDFGKFVTSSGAEVIESYSNFNYSRSLLFAWAIPYFHFGLRTSWPMGKHLTGGVQVVNGWNNDFSINGRATLGANVMLTYSKWSLMEDWYGGEDNEVFESAGGVTSAGNKGWRHLFDTVFTVTPTSKISAYVNYDYAQNRNFGISGTYFLANTDGTPHTSFADGSLARWQGIGAALKYQASSKLAFTPRFEVFDDANGFAMIGADSQFFNGTTPIRQTVKEVTITGEYKLMEGLEWRAEYRHDYSNEPFFVRGFGANTCGINPTPANCAEGFGLQNSKTQDTITIAFIGFFGPKR